MSKNKKIKTLLADDHAVVRSGIRQILESAEDIIVVAEAEDGNLAKKLIMEMQLDVAILDIKMPNVSGIEVTRWVREKRLPVGILILTAFDDDPYVIAVLQTGANGYILKSASPEEIINAVREVNQGKSVLDPSITQKLLIQMSKQEQKDTYDQLTDRELDVLTLAAKGFTNKAIGVRLGISARTVQGHLAHIFNKLQASSRTEAVMRAVSLGWLPSDITEIEQ